VDDEVAAARAILRLEIFESVDVVVVGPEWNTEETRVFRATLVSGAQ
jgi:hypothetical protein